MLETEIVQKVMFQSLSGLTLGLNSTYTFAMIPSPPWVSIPFRADTGFELAVTDQKYQAMKSVSIPFRADTGFELGTS